MKKSISCYIKKLSSGAALYVSVGAGLPVKHSAHESVRSARQEASKLGATLCLVVDTARMEVAQ